MSKKFVAACFAASALLAAPASAAVVEFDVSGLYMDDVAGGTGIYTPWGTFQFDTDSESVFDVNVTSIHNTYITGTYHSDTFGLFATFADPLGVVLNIDFSLSDLLAEIAGQAVGYSFSLWADPIEYHNELGDIYGVGIDPTLFGEVLTEDTVTPPIPLPAGFPLLLTALGGLAYLRRNRKS